MFTSLCLVPDVPSHSTFCQVVGAYICAMESNGTPSVLALSRQNCVNLTGSSQEAVAKGAYALCEHGSGSSPDIILVGTGREIIKPVILGSGGYPSS